MNTEYWNDNDRKKYMAARVLIVQDFIELFWASHRKSPTMREIATGTGMSRQYVNEALLWLLWSNKIVWKRNTARGIRIRD